MRQNINFGKLLHGGDYNPEQWLEYPEILEQDLAYFKKAKINEVSLGIFSWAFLEPEEGVFDLEWLKKMVDRLYENGISVMMATPTAARPRWMAQKYPDLPQQRIFWDSLLTRQTGTGEHCSPLQEFFDSLTESTHLSILVAVLGLYLFVTYNLSFFFTAKSSSLQLAGCCQIILIHPQRQTYQT